jgi:hypothetical protein
VRRSFFTFVLLLLASVVCSAAIPPVDVPETNYNESDTPVNQTPPVEIGVHFERPAQVATTVPKCILEARRHIQAPVREVLPLLLPSQHHSHALQALFCTLLI